MPGLYIIFQPDIACAGVHQVNARAYLLLGELGKLEKCFFQVADIRKGRTDPACILPRFLDRDILGKALAHHHIADNHIIVCDGSDCIHKPTVAVIDVVFIVAFLNIQLGADVAFTAALRSVG